MRLVLTDSRKQWSVYFDHPLSGALNYVFRLNRALSDLSESTLVDVIFMSQAPSSVNGNPRVQFHLNSTFPGREKYCQRTTGEGPLPDWNVAHEVKKSGLKMWGKYGDLTAKLPLVQLVAGHKNSSTIVVTEKDL